MPSELVRFHRGAIEDARKAWEWYAQQSASAANGFMAELDRAVNILSATPTQWPRHTQGTRRFVMRRFPFSVIYRVSSESDIHIIAIAHGRRRPDYWRERG